MDMARFHRRQTLLTLLALGLGPHSVRNVSARQAAVEPTLLASGEAELDPSALVAWRVVEDLAEVGQAAPFAEYTLGFAVVPRPFISLLLTDEATGEQIQLDPHEAAFVPEGTSQRRETLADSANSYLRLELVAATAANEVGGGRLRFPGPAFPAPAGPVTLSLYRAELAEGERVDLPPGAGETLVLIEQGAVELEMGEAAVRERLQTTVGSDTSYAIRSVNAAAMLYGAVDGTRVLVAAIA